MGEREGLYNDCTTFICKNVQAYEWRDRYYHRQMKEFILKNLNDLCLNMDENISQTNKGGGGRGGK